MACKSGERTVMAALRQAPGQVTIEGTRLSACLPPRGDPADIQAVGAIYIAAATELAGRARTAPDGEEATRLGYLVGAVRRSAASSQGIHLEMLRRLEQELVVVDTGSRAFREGERAGRSQG